MRTSHLIKSFILFLTISGLVVLARINSHCSVPTKKSEDSLYFWNLHDTVSYVGMAECKSCHYEIHSTFRHTGMGQSFGMGSRDKSKGTFPIYHQQWKEHRGNVVYDSSSGFQYQAFWRHDSLFIREFSVAPNSRGLVNHIREEFIPYIIGSGQHTNSHFWQDGDYLFQAPLTFYTQKGIWDLPPGYRENNIGFSRKIDAECMSCHNAMPSVSDQAKNLFEKIPLGIDCERCHGPGELHVQLKKKGVLVDTSKYADRSIVNPKRLPYNRQVDICQRCHLQGNNVLKEGKKFTDFRPGMKLSDVFEIYMPKYENEDYFVMAGHAERFQKSQCFIKSNPKNTEVYNPQINFTCINCHNPHVSVKSTNTNVFNQTCLNCHHENTSRSKFEQCKIETNTDECVACHMPASGAEDIPHVMVHDHKIQRPSGNTLNIEETKGQLLGLYAVNNPNPTKESEIKAYLSYFEKFNSDPIFLSKAKTLLDDNQDLIPDKIHFHYLKRNYSPIVGLSQELEVKDCDEWTAYRIAKSLDRQGSIEKSKSWYQRAYVLKPYDLDFTAEYTNCLIRLKQIEEAKKILLKQYMRSKKHFLTNLNLGSIYFLEREFSQAKRMFLSALKLQPRNKQVHLYLAELYQAVGDQDSYQFHLKKSR